MIIKKVTEYFLKTCKNYEVMNYEKTRCKI